MSEPVATLDTDTLRGLEDHAVLTGKPPRQSAVLRWESEFGGRRAYRCEARLHAEDQGGYSVSVPDLPGVASQGESKSEAIHSIREALVGVLEEYEASGTPIPWIDDPEPARPDEEGVWIRVNVG